MRIAVPSMDDGGLQAMRSGHFGHAAYMTVVVVEDGKVVDVEVHKNADHDAVGCGGVIDYTIGLGVDAMLAAGMGRPPFMRFTQAGIKVYFDATQPMVGDAIDLLLQGKVENMDISQACVH